MKQMMQIAVAVLGLVAAHGAAASPELAKARSCMACHGVANRLIGPGFREVAAKYAGQKDAETRLAAKVVKGSAGVWGPIPMPPNPQVSEADAAALVKWILAQK